MGYTFTWNQLLGIQAGAEQASCMQGVYNGQGKRTELSGKAYLWESDHSVVLHPLPNTRMIWRSNPTITVFRFTLCFHIVVLQGIDCVLLTSQAPLHPPTLYHFTLMSAYIRAYGESFERLMEYTHGAQSHVPCEVRNFVLNFNDYYKAALCRWM